MVYSICADFKDVAVLTGLQPSYTKILLLSILMGLQDKNWKAMYASISSFEMKLSKEKIRLSKTT